MFLIYINDIADGRTCETRLFADDGLLFRTIKSTADTASLQADINKVAEWAPNWQMRFNPTKCYLIRIYRGKSPILHGYHMHGHTLETVKIFLRRNLYRCSSATKDAAYKTTRPW